MLMMTYPSKNKDMKTKEIRIEQLQNQIDDMPYFAVAKTVQLVAEKRKLEKELEELKNG